MEAAKKLKVRAMAASILTAPNITSLHALEREMASLRTVWSFKM